MRRGGALVATVLAVLVYSVALGAASAPAGAIGAQPSVASNIDLTTRGLLLQSMKDPRWGPLEVVFPQYGLLHQRCGCLLSAWSTYFTYAVGFPGGGSIPWYAHMLRSLTGTSLLEPKFSFSPEYIDEYLQTGKDPDTPWTSGSGYAFHKMKEGMCGTSINRSALERMAEPVLFNGKPISPTGFTWRTFATGGGLFETAKAEVDKALGRNAPVVVRTVRQIQVGGQTREIAHFILLVGYDAIKAEYLFIDTAWPSSRAFPAAARPASQIWSGFSRAQMMGTITDVRVPTLVYEASWWLDIWDDPEPIELRLTSPDGRGTGYDPVSGSYVYEDPGGSYEIGNGLADPIGVLPTTEDARNLSMRFPRDGVYGLEVVGTGSGPYVLHLTTSVNGEKSPEQDINGTTSFGEIDRYEITLANAEIAAVNSVAEFAPHAVAGADQSTLLGAGVTVDAHRSFSIGSSITSYDWNLGDGSTSTDRRVTHTYATAGTYTATLTVTDAEGRTATDSLEVRVLSPPSDERTTTLVTINLNQGTYAPRLLTAWNQYSSTNGIALTTDGRHVAFAGGWYDLAVGDREPYDTDDTSRDVYVKDFDTGVTQRLTDGTLTTVQVTGISDDGRLILFRADTGWVLRDRGPDFSTTADDTSAAIPGAASSTYNRLSGDGRLVSYNTPAPVVPEDTNALTDGYVLDRQTGLSTRVTIGTNGSQLAAGGRVDTISRNGRFAVIQIGPYCHVRDLQLETTGPALDLRTAGDPNPGHDGCTGVDISDDGTKVVFRTLSQKFFAADQKEPYWRYVPETFLRDTVAQTTVHLGDPIDGQRPVETLIQHQGGFPNGSFVASMTPDGGFVAFTHRMEKVVAGDTNGHTDLFLYDTSTGITTRQSVRADGSQSWRWVEDQTPDTIAVDQDGNLVFGWVNDAAHMDDNDLIVEGGLVVTGLTDIFRRGPPAAGGEGSAPVADIGGPYVGFASTAEVPATIGLDASRSVDVDGDALTASIDPGDGSGPVDAPGLELHHAYANAGRLTAAAVASDATSSSAPASVEVEVLPSPGVDTVSFVPTCAAPGEAVRIVGVATSVNAALLDGGWNLADGPIPLSDAELTLSWTGATVYSAVSIPDLVFSTMLAAPASTGSHTARLGGEGGPEAILSIPCPPPPPPGPVADAGGPYEGFVGEPITLDGSLSSPAPSVASLAQSTQSFVTGGAGLEYTWDLGDGSDATGIQPTHTYQWPGTYLVTLMVTDGERTSDFDVAATRASALVTVRERDALIFQDGFESD